MLVIFLISYIIKELLKLPIEILPRVVRCISEIILPLPLAFDGKMRVGFLTDDPLQIMPLSWTYI